jgi:hypothetical protein
MDAILGYMIAIALSMLTMAQYFQFQTTGITNVQTAAAASQQFVVNKAAQQYVQDNGAVIAAQATATTPVPITAAMLINAGYLPTGFSQTNAFKQTWQVEVLQPAAGQLQAIVETIGGRAITDTLQLVQIASQTGAQGGFVPYAGQNGDPTMSPNNAYGAYGSWTIPLAGTGFTNPGSGHLVSLLAFTGVQSNNGFLYRVKVPNHAELNNMQTDLGLTDVSGTAHNIAGANQISTQSLLSLADGTKSVPSVQLANGTVIAYNQVGEGGVLGLTGSNGQRIYLESLNGTFRLVNSAWNAQLFTVDQSGNVVANGTVQAGNVAVPRTACSGTGIAGDSDGSGLMLSCQRGVWLPIGGTALRYGYYTVANGYGVPAPTCSAGGTPQIIVDYQSMYIDNTATANIQIAGTGPWVVYFTDGSGAGIPGWGVATTYCTY